MSTSDRSGHKKVLVQFKIVRYTLSRIEEKNIEVLNRTIMQLKIKKENRRQQNDN